MHQRTPRPARSLVAALVLATALAGCFGGAPPTAGKTPVTRPRGTAGTVKTAPIPAEALEKATAGLATRVLPPTDQLATLTGKVKLLSDHGAGIISDNSAGVISNNAGGIISNNAGGIISDNAAGVIANNGPSRALRQATAAPPAELALADAVVTVHDATGKLLTTPDGKPLAAFTDHTGAYRLEAPLPAENLVLRVRLWNGGELQAMHARAGGAGDEQPVDTATSLGAAYVLGEFVKGNQATFDKLPASEAALLREALEVARGALGKAPTYQAAELRALAADRRAQSPAVERKLADIRALLIGQARIGDGRPATEVAFPVPGYMHVDRRGHLLFGDATSGRVRELALDGTLGTFADLLRGSRVKRNFPDAYDLAEGPDGTCYVSAGAFIYRIAPDGATTVLAGTGQTTRGALGGPATATNLEPHNLAVGPDGTVYLVDGASTLPAGAEAPAAQLRQRLAQIGPDGLVRELPHEAPPGHFFTLGLDVAKDGTFTALFTGDGDTLHVWRWKAGGAPTELFVRRNVPDPVASAMAVGTDGTVAVTNPGWPGVELIAPDGTGRTLNAPALSEPGVVAFGRDGTLYVADQATALIGAFAPGGTISRTEECPGAQGCAGGTYRVVAGASGAVQTSGDLTAIALNQPFGAAYDADDRLIFSEMGGFSLKRFSGLSVDLVAGARRGGGGDGAAALAAQLSAPTALAHHAGTTWFESNSRLRAVGPDGVIRTVVGRAMPAGGSPGDGPHEDPLLPDQRPAPDEVAVAHCRGIAIGPDGRPYWSLARNGQICRLAADGRVEVVAGRHNASGTSPEAIFAALGDEAESQPAREARLAMPVGLAFDAAGDLYVAEAFGCRIRRITGLTTETPTIHRFAGEPVAGLLARAGATTTRADGRPASDTALIVPLGLCFDRAGTLYVSLLGARNLRALVPMLGTDAALPLELPPVEAHVGRVEPDGTWRLVAGPNTRYFADSGAEDALTVPAGLAVDSQGRLAIADVGANLLRILPPGTAAATP